MTEVGRDQEILLMLALGLYTFMYMYAQMNTYCIYTNTENAQITVYLSKQDGKTVLLLVKCFKELEPIDSAENILGRFRAAAGLSRKKMSQILTIYKDEQSKAFPDFFVLIIVCYTWFHKCFYYIYTYIDMFNKCLFKMFFLKS